MIDVTAELTVAAQTAYPPLAASARVRLVSFAPFLAPLGVTLDYRPTLTDDDYRAMVNGRGGAAMLRPALASLRGAARQRAGTAADVVLVHRLRSLTPAPGLEFSRRIDVYDFDDAMYLPSGVGTGGLPHLLKRESQRWRRYVEMARLVVAGNEILASAALGRAPRVEVVPSCVDPALQPTRVHIERDAITVGWIGSPATSGFLHPLLPVFEQINRDRLRARLLCLGASRLPPAPWLEQRPWSLDAERAELSRFDVGIMPMPDNRWNQGKCGYKLLEYFSAGVPAIASPVGINPRLVGDERGYLATSADEWRAALEGAIGDATARRQQGEAARAFVEREYSYRRWAPELAELLRSLL